MSRRPTLLRKCDPFRSWRPGPGGGSTSASRLHEEELLLLQHEREAERGYAMTQNSETRVRAQLQRQKGNPPFPTLLSLPPVRAAKTPVRCRDILTPTGALSTMLRRTLCVTPGRSKEPVPLARGPSATALWSQRRHPGIPGDAALPVLLHEPCPHVIRNSN